MRIKTTALLLLITAYAYADSTFFSPSLFYTRGDYSNGIYSDSYAGYLGIGNYRQSVIFSYENLRMKNKDWKYVQNFFNAGGRISFGDVYLRLNYGHISGTYNSIPPGLSSSDHNDLYSADAYYTDYFSFAGGSYTYQSQGGYLSRSIHQVMLRFEHIPHWRVLLSAKPLFTKINDGRELWGVNLRFHYVPFDYFVVKAHGFLGERAYFFDPDLLVLNNQDETQKYLAALQLEYYILPDLIAAGGVQHASFGSYKINYYILGIRSNFLF